MHELYRPPMGESGSFLIRLISFMASLGEFRVTLWLKIVDLDFIEMGQRTIVVVLVVLVAVKTVMSDDSRQHHGSRQSGRRSNNGGRRSTTTTTTTTEASSYADDAGDAAYQDQPSGTETCEVARLKCAYRVGCGMALQVILSLFFSILLLRLR